MNQFVLAITGPTGSGKTTVSECIAKKLDRCVNIDADHIKHMIVSGFYKDETNAGGWGFNQWGLVGSSIGILATNFLKNGYSVIINGYLDEPAWSQIQECVEINCRVLLLPNLKSLIQRDAERPSEITMGEPSVRQHFEAFSEESFYDDFARLDTSNQDVEETAEDILKLIS